MRLLLAAIACCVLTAPAAGADHAFPYKALVNANEVYVRSGPGQSYYPTDKLTAGQEVEVYRHDPGGWYAIRPVQESFSWVAARYLKPAEDNLATVNEDNVAARVGSRFSDIRDVIQIRLHKGEAVELQETKHAAAGPGDKERWCKITPPSGEFRWVFGKYVDAEYARDGLRKHQPGAEQAAHEGNATAGADKKHHRKGALAAELEAEEASRSAGAGRSMSREEFQAELDAIDMELTIMVVEEPTVWTFDGLRPRAESLLSQAETAVERGRARVLINKIARFNDLKQRYDAVAALREETERSNRRLARLSPQLHGEGRDVTVDRRFDGMGKLTEVPAPRPGAPRYALVDEKGDVQCYVSPAPGVSLRPYVGRQVGITGTRGYMPEQRAQHLMARRVSVVEDRIVR